MDWTSTQFIIWVIEAAGFLTMIVGTSLIIKALNKMEGELKNPLKYLLFSFLTYLVLGIYVTIAVTKQFPFDSYLWIITFALGLLFAIFLVIGGKKLLEEIDRS